MGELRLAMGNIDSLVITKVKEAAV